MFDMRLALQGLGLLHLLHLYGLKKFSNDCALNDVH